MLQVSQPLSFAFHSLGGAEWTEHQNIAQKVWPWPREDFDVLAWSCQRGLVLQQEIGRTASDSCVLYIDGGSNFILLLIDFFSYTV